MPISLGVALLAGTSLARSERRILPEPLVGMLTGALAALAVTIDLIGFVVALGRYSVGARRAVSITGHWQPPLGGPMVTAIEAICVCWLAWIALGAKRTAHTQRRLRRREGPPSTPPPASRVGHHERQRKSQLLSTGQPVFDETWNDDVRSCCYLGFQCDPDGQDS